MSEKVEQIQNKIDLLTDQLENLERSGFYTEKQIDSLSKGLCRQIFMLKIELENKKILDSILKNIKSQAPNFNHSFLGSII